MSTRTADGLGFQMMGCFRSNKKFRTRVLILRYCDKKNTFDMKYVKIHSFFIRVSFSSLRSLHLPSPLTTPTPHCIPCPCHPLLVHALLEGFLFLSFLPFMSNLSFMRPFSSPLQSISIPLSRQQNPHDAKMAPDAPALALL